MPRSAPNCNGGNPSRDRTPRGGPGAVGPTSFDRPAKATAGADTVPALMQDLQSTLGLTPAQAAGIVGNFNHETGGFRYMQEISPRAGRGGLGWAQWTGPRRRAFEAWAKRNGLSTDSYEANLGFLLEEMKGPEGRALAAIRNAKTPEEASRIWMNMFERPGVKASLSRERAARAAFDRIE